jgi:hypothetical protein
MAAAPPAAPDPYRLPLQLIRPLLHRLPPLR